MDDLKIGQIVNYYRFEYRLTQEAITKLTECYGHSVSFERYEEEVSNIFDTYGLIYNYLGEEIDEIESNLILTSDMFYSTKLPTESGIVVELNNRSVAIKPFKLYTIKLVHYQAYHITTPTLITKTLLGHEWKSCVFTTHSPYFLDNELSKLSLK